MKTFINKILVVTIITSFFVPFVFMEISFAQTNVPTDASKAQYTLLEPLPDLTGKGGVVTNVEFKSYVEYAFNLILALAAAAAVFMIVLGGFQYMTTDSWREKSDGINKAKNALLGLVLILSSYLLLKTIDPRLVYIPSTLVKPLAIEYKKTNADFMNAIDSDIKKFKVQNIVIIESNEKDRQEIRKITDENTFVLSSLGEYFGVLDPTEEEMVKLCSDATDTDVREQCKKLSENAVKIKDLNINIVKNTGIGVMDAIQQKCYGQPTVLLAECKEEMAKKAMEYSNTLSSAGAPDKARAVQNYALFSQSTASMYAAIKTNIGPSPGKDAALDLLKNSTIVVGAVVGFTAGPVGSIIGGATGAVVIDNMIAGSDKAAAEKTIVQIQESYNEYIDKLTDPKTKTLLIEQTNTILKSLDAPNSGMVNGTKVNIPKKESTDVPVNFSSSVMAN